MSAPSPGMMAHTAQVHAEQEINFHGITAPAFVALSMVVVLLIIWFVGGFKTIGKGLDTKIATIRKQLDEATALRAEAEAIRADYQAKAAQAQTEAESIVAQAKVEAMHLVEQAKADADTLIERRRKMAEDKIAAAERAAIADVRAKAAGAAAGAAATLIAQRHDAAADKALVERTIAGLN
jgi:F-type H+-transporting ATPase subunit b